MINKNEIPNKGIIYALYKDKVIFEKYVSVDDLDISEEDLLELHCFDENKEYRYMDGKDKVISNQDGDDTYEENVITLHKKNGTEDESIDQRDHLEQRLKVMVVNYIEYDENDMLRIKNYRLKEVE